MFTTPNFSALHFTVSVFCLHKSRLLKMIFDIITTFSAKGKTVLAISEEISVLLFLSLV